MATSDTLAVEATNPKLYARVKGLPPDSATLFVYSVRPPGHGEPTAKHRLLASTSVDTTALPLDLPAGGQPPKLECTALHFLLVTDVQTVVSASISITRDSDDPPATAREREAKLEFTIRAESGSLEGENWVVVT